MKKLFILSLLILLSVKTFGTTHIVHYDTTTTVYGCSGGDTIKFYAGTVASTYAIFIYRKFGTPSGSPGSMMSGGTLSYILTSNDSAYQIIRGIGSVSVGGDFIFISGTGINESEKENVKLFPNPVVSTLNISGDKEMDIKIYNVMGELILTRRVFNSSQIDLSLFNKGLYMVQVNNRSYRIIKY